MSEFKDVLTYLRKREKLSQRELAVKLHVSASTIGMYESGKRFPSREQEEEIADFFNVSLSVLRGIGDEYTDNQYTIETAQLLNSIKRNERLRKFIDVYSSLPEKDRDAVENLANFLSERNK